MKSIITRKAVLLLLMLLSPGAFAVIIEGTIRGTLKSIDTYEDYVPIEGYWENTELGSEVVGTFWYDTDSFPGGYSSATAWEYYDEYSDWLGSSVTIGGKTYNLSDIASEPRSPIASKPRSPFFYDAISILQNNPPTSGASLWLLDIVGQENRGFRLKMMDFNFAFDSSEYTPFDRWGIVKDFDWYDVDDAATSANFYFSLEINEGDKRSLSGATVDVDEFQLRIKKPANVPEPSLVMLLCLGIIAFVIKFKINQ